MNNNLYGYMCSRDVGHRPFKLKHRSIDLVLLYGWVFLPCSLCTAMTNVELPVDGVIQSGLATIDQNEHTLNIHQSSQNLISTWGSFNIGPEATVNFHQPSHSAVAINYILDRSASQIMGQLNANGQVFLLNPNGIIFSQSAQVNVGGLVASTLELNPLDMETGTFTLIGDAVSTATIENQGKISSSNGGVLALIAPNISNTGSLNAADGMIHLTSASQVTLALQDGSLTQYQVDQGVLQGLIANGGAIIAENGAVYLTAKAKDDLSHVVINHTGVIEANRLIQNAQGEIILWADPQYGELNVSGSLIAEGKNAEDGGWIESSAAQVNISDDVQVSTFAEQGKIGTWFIDPENVMISSTAQTDLSDTGLVATENDSVIDVALLQAALNNNQVIVSASALAGSQGGNIEVNAEIYWDAATALTLSADNNININADITATNSESKLNLQYGQTAANIEANYYLNDGATINLHAGNNLTILKGPDAANTIEYQVITSLGNAGSTTATDLQGIRGDLSQNYALGADIDAQASKSWNSGSGFNPIGSNSSPFTGVFNGLGHSISNLTVYRSSQYYVGLFAYISYASIENLSLIGGSVLGSSYAGALVGYNAYGDIRHVDVSSSVIANAASSNVYAGGVVGYNNNGSITDASSTGRVYASSTNASAYAGGLVGVNDHATLSQGYATGSAGANSTYGNTVAGGLVGYNKNSSISEAYATGTVSASGVLAASYAGGLVGSNDNGTIENTYATGKVTSSASTAKAYAGGLVGYNLMGSINQSYATGWVSARSSTSTAYTGGLVPWSSGTVSDSFWDLQSTGQDSSAGDGLAKTTLELQEISTFADAGWEIDDQGGTANIWRIYDGLTQPLLRSFLTLVDLEYHDLTTTYNGQIQSVNLILPSGVDSSKLFMLSAAESKNVGSYDYDYYSNQQGYDLLNAEVTLTILPADLTLTALDQTKTYGESLDFTGTEYSAAGLVNNESIERVSLSSLGAAATAAVNHGVPYTIEIGDIVPGNGFDAQNYQISYITGDLIITQKDLLVTANSLDTIYNGQAQTLSGFTATGWVNGETAMVLPEVLASVTAKNVGLYRAIATGTDDNYALSFIDGVLNIRPASIVNITGITAYDQLYNGLTTASLNTDAAEFNGIYSGDQLSVATAVGQFADADVGQAKTVYISELSLGGADADNYHLVETTAVTQASIEALPEPDTVATPPFTITMSYLQAIQFASDDNNKSTTTNESDSHDAASSSDVVNTSGIETLEGDN